MTPHNAYIGSIRDREFKAEMEFAAASRRENITLALESRPARSRGTQSTSLGLRIQIPRATPGQLMA